MKSLETQIILEFHAPERPRRLGRQCVIKRAVFCTCRLPWNKHGPLVQCQMCKEWFHQVYMKIISNQFSLICNVSRWFSFLNGCLVAQLVGISWLWRLKSDATGSIPAGWVRWVTWVPIFLYSSIIKKR